MTDYFSEPHWLWLLVLIPFLVIGGAYLRRTTAELQRLWGSAPTNARRFIPTGRLLILILLLSLAAAGPKWGEESIRTRGDGRDLLVLLDVSRSMLAEDLPPENRLDRARRELLTLLAELERLGRADRLAVMVFAGPVRLLCPFTFDYDAVRGALAEAHPHVFSSADRLSVSPRDRLSIVLTEVAELVTDDLAHVDLLLLSDGDWGDVRLPESSAFPVAPHIFGLGDSARGWPIPTGDAATPFLLQARSDGVETVLSRRNDAVLRRLAEMSGGILLTEEQGGLVDWWRRHLRDLPGREAAARSGRMSGTLSPLLILAALPLLAWPLLPVWRNRAPATGLLVAATLGLGWQNAASELATLQRAQAAFHRGDFATALEHYTSALPRSPDPGFISFNQAACWYELNAWAEAANAYRRCLEDATGRRAAQAWLGRGNALAQLGSRQPAARGAALLKDALRCYAEAEAHFRKLPAAESEPWLDDLGANRAAVETVLQHKQQERSENEDTPPASGGASPETDQRGVGDQATTDADPSLATDVPGLDRGSLATDKERMRPGVGNLPLVLTGAEPLSEVDAAAALAAALERLRRVRELRGAGTSVLGPEQRDW